jgi:hypothetical protein
MKHLIDETVGGPNHPIRPHHIADGQFWSAFDNVETEASALWIVRFAKMQGAWLPFTEAEIEHMDRECTKIAKGVIKAVTDLDPVSEEVEAGWYSVNRLPDQGYIVKGGDGKYRVTHEFICRCFEAAPRFKAGRETGKNGLLEIFNFGIIEPREEFLDAAFKELGTIAGSRKKT